MTRILCITLLCFVQQCNNKDDDPQSPPPDQSQTTASVDECPQLALEAFALHIQPAIDASCSDGSCHGDDADAPGGGLLLMKKEDSDTVTVNRTKMSTHRNKWLIEKGKLLDSMLLDKLTDITHEGGDQIAQEHITEEGITAWVAAERRCSRSEEAAEDEEAAES